MKIMKFENQKFTGQISLDYNEFIDCEFENCAILFHGGDFSITRTKFTNVNFGVAHAANNTLLFLRLVKDINPKALEQLLENVKGVSDALSGSVH